mmetsp:Transcript_18205/g.35762  ORF Transcript_18205/g.35762 Transcript_18205/m.35762 type:complete len:132 (-) Transcript_18205:269-664(-)|eukprot:CAMPEP_0171527572 /NCGR_PEP_ID=MMETSP0959-20130129/11133_1 /TAXON_ID=87120 /ORGANISM="Aurantiochytrium limacinum, Strain ATCCMYA-1381" /LENGTH=131 /DNA_ID=CAMNT_0012069341 /DNA_START=30 /DNA_END=425 /DNA_ORIENTATION=+
MSSGTSELASGGRRSGMIMVTESERHRIQCLLALKDSGVAEDLDRASSRSVEAAGQIARSIVGDAGNACIKVAAASERFHQRCDQKVQALETKMFTMLQNLEEAKNRASHIAAAREQLATCLIELPRGHDH